MALDPDSLARAVEAALDRFASEQSWSTEECVDSATFHEFRALTWAAKDDPRLLARSARDAFSTVYAHVNRRGEAGHDAALTELLDAVQSRNDLDWEDGFWGDAHYDAALRVEQALRRHRPDVAPHA